MENKDQTTSAATRELVSVAGVLADVTNQPCTTDASTTVDIHKANSRGITVTATQLTSWNPLAAGAGVATIGGVQADHLEAVTCAICRLMAASGDRQEGNVGENGETGAAACGVTNLPNMGLWSGGVKATRVVGKLYVEPNIDNFNLPNNPMALWLGNGMWRPGAYHDPTHARPIATDSSFEPAAVRRIEGTIDDVAVPIQLVPWTAIPRAQLPTNGHGLWSYEVGGALRTRAPPISEEYRPSPIPTVVGSDETWAHHMGLETKDGVDLTFNKDLVVLVSFWN